MNTLNRPPVVLALSGHDPSGGAGIQADIEAIASQECHACSIITCLTVQDSCNVRRIEPIADYLIMQQAEILQADMPLAAIKIGLLGSVDVVLAVHSILLQNPNIPVVLDPILAAGGGQNLETDGLIQAIRQYLLPLTTLVTPNLPELTRLTTAKTLDAQIAELFETGCKAVLVTGTHADSPQVVNTLFENGRNTQSWEWERLPEIYHGSGCTLAATCAANLAKGLDTVTAVAHAQNYTWHSLQAAYHLGKCQWQPKRWYHV